MTASSTNTPAANTAPATVTPITPMTAPVPIPAPRNKRRVLMIAGPLVLLAAAGGYWLMGGRYEETENAYLHQARIAVASSVPGRIDKVLVKDNQTVKAGDVLFQVDPVPYKLAQAQADAAVTAARITVEQLKLAYGTAQSNLQLAEDEAAYQTVERERQESLGAKGVATDSNLIDARHAERTALDKRDLAKQAVASALAAIGGDPLIPTDNHPAVRATVIAREQAAYDYANAVVKAPANGVIYQASSFKPGQMVAAGQSLFALVQTDDIWVDANFKETQLAGITVGAPAELTFDADPGRKIEAVVAAIGAGTGSEFSLLPAQNATGNWVKVTQRVPVTLKLVNPADAAGLASGVSASVSVDTGRHRLISDLLPSFLK
ncbi:HlyD family secretion protein [Cypionkella sp.]|uniref:HlyD family secretion protein n=1 Tax=Cypionkella sp. TaxID=2811411 RepID=UPI00271D43D0|nr:HlyD family secretion protein [Cypionkella sp.]MDO8985737.1 HlyD family secretion protein [Cypionkella sp.]MDP1575370.1 HlyD family secretion protein [Cypionkella sp.]MDP2051317.1 HlyD family secretion protein [Cypionkella sp.]